MLVTSIDPNMVFGEGSMDLIGLYDNPLKRRGLGVFPCTMLIAQHPSRRLSVVGGLGRKYVGEPFRQPLEL